MAGKASLTKRVAAGEIYIGESDKGKGLVVMSPETYHQMSKVHTEGDREITWRELGEVQREVRAHSRALARIFKLGKAGGKRNAARCYDNISS